MEKPVYHGVKPSVEDWLDDVTFVIYFAKRIEKENDEPIMKQLYAEVHLDEDNDVIIGENWYEVVNGEEGDFIDAFYEFDDMSQEVKTEICNYALERMKSYQE